MENCIVCLESNADIFARIAIDSSEWKEFHIQHIIQKHLWWWYLRKSTNDSVQWICRQCWQELSSFHNFYIKVENEHYQLNMKLMSTLNSDSDENLVVVKQECTIFDSGYTLTEGMMPLEKRKKGRKKKGMKNIEQIQIEELPPVVIKNENELFVTQNLDKTKKEYQDGDLILDYEIDDIMKTSESLDDIWEPNININNNTDTDDGNENGNENIFVGFSNDINSGKLSLKDTVHRKRKTKTRKDVSQKKKKVTKKQQPDSKNEICKKSEVSKKNDEFLAESKFELTCNLCKVPLVNFSKLKSHYRQEHNTLGHVMCCNRKFFKRGLLVDHLRVHKDPNYFKCPHCDRILANRVNFENHIEYHKESKEPRDLIFNCDKCEKSFFKKASLERHQLLHVPEDEKQFQCNECDKKFATGYLLKQHTALTHLYKYAKICDICGKLLRDKFSFVRHMAEHNGATPAKVPCDICGVELTNKYLLNRHKKKLHTEANLKEQICPYCSKVSPNLSAHRHHVQYSHTLERKHACHMCDKKFKRPKELKEHLSTHTGEALYTCPHCPRTFISNGNLHKHRKLSHRKEWEEGRLKKLTAQQLKVLTHQDGSSSSCALTAATLQESYAENLTMVNALNL